MWSFLEQAVGGVAGFGGASSLYLEGMTTPIAYRQRLAP